MSLLRYYNIINVASWSAMQNWRIMIITQTHTIYVADFWLQIHCLHTELSVCHTRPIYCCVIPGVNLCFTPAIHLRIVAGSSLDVWINRLICSIHSFSCKCSGSNRRRCLILIANSCTITCTGRQFQHPCALVFPAVLQFCSTINICCCAMCGSRAFGVVEVFRLASRASEGGWWKE